MTNLLAAAAFVLSLIIVAALIMIYPVQAQGWPESEWRKPAQVQQPVRRHVHRPRVKKLTRKKRNSHGRHPAATVKAWRKLDGFQDNRHCKDIVEAVGQRRASNDRAMDDVKENWHQIVVSKYGVMFADIENARQITDACVSVSRPGVMSSTSEILTREKLQDRQCILKARPCGPKEIK